MPINAHDVLLRRADPGCRPTGGLEPSSLRLDDGSVEPAGIAHTLRRTGYEPLRRILSKTKEAVIWALVDHANHATSNVLLQQLTTDLFALNRWADRFEEDLLSSLFAPPSPRLSDQTSATGCADEGEELSLLDKESFERSLEAKKLAEHLAQRFASELAGLEELLRDCEAPSPSAIADELPVSPTRIAQSLSDLTDAMEMGTPSRQVVFECARVMFERDLGAIYWDLLAALGGEGDKWLRSRTIPTPRQSTSATRPATGPKSTGETGAPPPRPRDRAPESATTLPPSATACWDNPPPASKSALGTLWTHLQPSAELSSADIVEGLDRAARAQGFEKGLESGDRQRAHLATQLWDLVEEDATLSSSAESWRRRLQLPLLAAVTTDPEFFTRDDHPVRILLDRLDELGGLINSADDAGLTRSIRDTVEHVLTQLNGPTILDRTLLRQLASSVEELAEGQSQKYQRNVERVVKACAGRDRLRHCRDRVQSELDQRYAGRRVPAVFAELLDSAWRTLLEITLLKQGEDSPGYQAHWETLDALVQRLGGEPHRIVNQLPGADKLMERLAAGLDFATVDPLKRAALLERVRRVLAETSPDVIDLAPYTPSHKLSQAAPTPPTDGGDEEWHSALEGVKNVRVGDTIVLRGAPEARKRLRLAWIGEGGWLYTLVDQRGFKAADLTADQLTRKLASRQVEIEPGEERPLTERAIDQMLDNLREQVKHQAASDDLTDLNNPSRFQTLLARTLADARAGIPHVLLWIDVDQFTVLRNTFGLEAADQLRVAISRLLKEQFAGKGILANLGGDQFAATITRCAKDRGLQLADAFRRSVADMSFAWEGAGIPASVSVGVIDLAETNASCADVLQTADATLFAAKRGGGNRCILYSGNDGVIHRRKSSMEWLKRVDQALDRGSLDLRCQRIAPVDPASGLELHYEVLLGIHDEDGESLDINHFIAAAESYNRMWAVDRWVARTAFEWAAEHPGELERLGGLAINLSGQSMNDEGIVDFLHALFSETGVSPERISFEATETVAITNLSRASHIIRAIKSMGSSFALDDFGSGFSSYSYLRQLPVDWLKIDGAFVRGIHRDPADYGVVKSIHEIGHFMGKRTIAEYVEDDDILVHLREIGVDYAQGYRIEMPRRLAELG